MALSSADLAAVNLDVATLWATTGRDTEPGLTWGLGWAPEEDEDVHGRVVFGTLRAFGDSGGGQVMITSVVTYPKSVNPSNEEFEQALAGSDAAETIYDTARIALRTVLAVVDAGSQIPRLAPEAELSKLKRAGEEPSESEVSPESPIAQD